MIAKQLEPSVDQISLMLWLQLQLQQQENSSSMGALDSLHLRIALVE
jgi:hypothetical protein